MSLLLLFDCFFLAVVDESFVPPLLADPPEPLAPMALEPLPDWSPLPLDEPPLELPLEPEPPLELPLEPEPLVELPDEPDRPPDEPD